MVWKEPVIKLALQQENNTSLERSRAPREFSITPKPPGMWGAHSMLLLCVYSIWGVSQETVDGGLFSLPFVLGLLG